ncbi:molybdopterin molybdotransferase MoeA [Helicobacter mesocricetorum]|uniref:molybdopterin molybdotransferase MoeA n=1 Tax=Helicobacter mesocricetorum TaxID=87012 RepID=UPI001F3CE511|nr:molybdopterin molybdotransferase MoeA [Helicobacter mesocricetorum]
MITAMMSIQEAMDTLVKAGRGFQNNEEILPLQECLGRFLAQNILCKKPLPAFDNSAMDGYAACVQDEGKRVRIIHSVFAGDCEEREIRSGECVKIMTGAKMPKNANCVIPFEEIEGGLGAQGDIVLPKTLKEGANIRKMGEEAHLDSKLLSRGEALDEYHLTLLASQGIAYTKVFESLKINVLSGGNELKEPWESSHSYQTYNSNTTMILATLKSFGFCGSYGGVLPDKKEILTQALQKPYDVILTTGGASRGEADWMRVVLQECGAQMLIDGIKIKPGKPTMVARLGEKFIVALPGNPLAAAVLLRLLILPFLRQISGASKYHPQYLLLKNCDSFKLKSRMNAMLGDITSNGFYLTQKGKYNSGEILPLLKSNALAIFDEQSTEIPLGREIKVLPYQMLWSEEKSDIINHL